MYLGNFDQCIRILASIRYSFADILDAVAQNTFHKLPSIALPVLLVLYLSPIHLTFFNYRHSAIPCFDGFFLSLVQFSFSVTRYAIHCVATNHIVTAFCIMHPNIHVVAERTGKEFCLFTHASPTPFHEQLCSRHLR